MIVQRNIFSMFIYLYIRYIYQIFGDISQSSLKNYAFWYQKVKSFSCCYYYYFVYTRNDRQVCETKICLFTMCVNYAMS